MKIEIGDISIVIEPGDDPNQIINMANAIGRQQDTSTARVIFKSPAAPKPRRLRLCRGRGRCASLYHQSTKRSHKETCETYEFVASYKHGRTSKQVADWSNVNQDTAGHRLASLVESGLLVRNGRIYVKA